VKRQNPKPQYRAGYIEELEPRVLLSAGLEAFLIENVTIEREVLTPSATQAEPTSGSDITEAESVVAVKRHELVFIDTTTPNYERLVFDLYNQTDKLIEVILIDSDENGIQEITETLQYYQNIDAVHCISHGN